MNALFILTSFEKVNIDGSTEQEIEVNKDATTFAETRSITIEVKVLPKLVCMTKRLKKIFTVNNSKTNQIDVVDLKDPTNPKKLTAISLTSYNGVSKSVATYEGKLAVALESTTNK